MDTLTLDRAQVDAQVGRLDGEIAEGEIRLNVLYAEIERLRGQRQVWTMLAEALKERAD